MDFLHPQALLREVNVRWRVLVMDTMRTLLLCWSYTLHTVSVFIVEKIFRGETQEWRLHMESLLVFWCCMLRCLACTVLASVLEVAVVPLSVLHQPNLV